MGHEASISDAGAIAGPDGASTDAPAADHADLPPVGYIRNPKSHRNKGHEDEAAQLPGVTMAAPRTRAELEEALADFAQREIGLLAISGGDGTIRDVLTRGAPFFAGNWPDIIVLPQGKTNALAYDLGINNPWSLREALEAARRGKVVHRHPLLAEQIDGEQRVRYGFILGAGVFDTAIEAGQLAHRYGAFQSFAIGVTALFGMVQALFGFGSGPWRRASGIKITLADGKTALQHSGLCPAEQRYFVSFTTLQRFPLGLSPFGDPVAGMPIRHFIVDAPLRRAVALLPAGAMGWESPLLARLGMRRGADRAYRIELDGNFILDGERYPPGKYKLMAGPELRFISP